MGLAGLIIFSWDLRVAMMGIDDSRRSGPDQRALVLGLDPYDPVTWRDTAVLIGTAHIPDNAVYVYPPWVAIALVPFALLSSRDAGTLWTVIGMASAIVAVGALLRAYLPDVDWAHGVGRVVVDDLGACRGHVPDGSVDVPVRRRTRRDRAVPAG